MLMNVVLHIFNPLISSWKNFNVNTLITNKLIKFVAKFWGITVQNLKKGIYSNFKFMLSPKINERACNSVCKCIYMK